MDSINQAADGIPQLLNKLNTLSKELKDVHSNALEMIKAASIKTRKIEEGYADCLHLFLDLMR